jgi:hypothetical protein
MNRLYDITFVETTAGFEETVIENFIKNNLPPIAGKESKTSGMGNFNVLYKEIDWCAAETPVRGTIELFFTTKNTLRRISVPALSRFIVFCSWKENNDYKVTWSCSLS